MVTALLLIPGTATVAIESRADSIHHCEPFFHQPFVDHARSGLVLEAGHHLAEVGEGGLRTVTVRPTADEQSTLIRQGKGAHMVPVIIEILTKVIAKEGSQRGLNLFRLQEIPQSHNVGHVLPHQLVNEAPVAQLKIRISEVGLAHTCA